MPQSSLTADTGISQRQILRRYLDLPKFVDLLRSKSLYLPRADGFADRLEGALFPTLRRVLNESHREGASEYDADGFYRRARLGNYVSCWSLGARDNMALWQIYGASKNSLAITTTVDQLIKVALPWREQVHLHRVKYLDHTKVRTWVVGRYADTLRYKNDAYRYERELRIVVGRNGPAWEDNPPGIRLSVDLDVLLRSVVVSPESTGWFYEAVQDLCLKYSIKAPVRRSKLALLPT
jgi:hypothetical protein